MRVDVRGFVLDDARGDRVLRASTSRRCCGRVRVRAVRGAVVLGAGWLPGGRALCSCVRARLCVGRSVGSVGDVARGGERGVVSCGVLAGLQVPAYSC